MAIAQKCLRCDAPLGRDARAGLCPKCLFAGLVEIHSNENDRPSPEIDDSDFAGTFKPATRFGSYELQEEIGRGGMGIIFKARQLSLGRSVAIKLLLAGQFADAGFIRRFRTEATAAGMLKHPNIVGIHEVGIHEGQHYLVMDYVEGRSLAAVCGTQALAVRRAARFVKTIAEAIHHAHERGILHRDLKPSNIVIDATDQPHVTDFGLAKRFDSDSQLTLTGQLLGSPNYMPPEQASPEKGKIGRHSDIYSLGAILYHLLSGRPPFIGETISSILHQLLQTDPRSPRLINPSVPQDLETICLKCLEKEPGGRYATAQELADDLGRFQNDEPILARPVSRFEHFWRWCRRNRGLSLACTLLLLLLLTILIGSPIAAFRINQQRLQVEEQRQHVEVQRERAVKSEAEARDHLYAARMNMAQHAWEQNNIGQLRQLLDATRDDVNRGFEWHYWRKQISQERISMVGHNAPVRVLSFSPNGQWLLSLSRNQKLILWDLATGREKLGPEMQEVSAAAFSLDGTQLFLRQFDRTRVLDIESGKEVAIATVEENLLSPSSHCHGRRILEKITRNDPGSSGHETMLVRDFISGQELLRLTNKSDNLTAGSFSRDGDEILTGAHNGTLALWDSHNGRETRQFLGHTAMVRDVAFSPDNRLLLSGGQDQTARLWDRDSGKEHFVLTGHSGPIHSVAFSPDGQTVLTASFDQTSRVWDAKTGRELRAIKGHKNPVWAVAFSPQSDLIATAGHSGSQLGESSEIKVWNPHDGGEYLTLWGHGLNSTPDAKRIVKSVDFSPDGKRLVTAGHDRTVKIWDIDHGKETLTFTRHKAFVQAALFSPDGDKILSLDSDGNALLWRSTTGAIIRQFESDGAKDLACPLAFSHDGKRIAAGSLLENGTGSVRIWNVETGTLTVQMPRTSAICSLSFSPEGRFLASSHVDWVARLWDSNTGKQLRMFGHSNWVRSVVFSKDGGQLLTASEDRTIKTWDSTTGNELHTFRGHKDGILSAVFSPAGDRILSGSYDNTAILWDSLTGHQLLTLKGHSGTVLSTAFSPDGHRIATASWDGAARVWEAPK